MSATETRSAYPLVAGLPTRWADNDSYGHVNNVVYYAYFDTVVNAQLVRDAGFDPANDAVVGYVVETSCNFHQPISFPETIDVGLRVASLGRSSVVYELAVFGRDATAAATGRFVHVWVERATGRPAPIPDPVRAALLPLIASTPDARPIAASEPRRPRIDCEPMTPSTRDAARRLLGEFLSADRHYRASATAYGDGGARALDRALDLFLARPELGFVWIAFATDADGRREAAGACVVCRAVSTSRGAIVAKLDDVHVAKRWQRRGVGTAMLASLFEWLASSGVARVDSACHRDNAAAWTFYERLGFRPLDEERIALLLDPAERA